MLKHGPWEDHLWAMIVIDPTNLLIASVYGLNGHMPSMHAVPLCTCSFGLAALHLRTTTWGVFFVKSCVKSAMMWYRFRLEERRLILMQCANNSCLQQGDSQRFFFLLCCLVYHIKRASQILRGKMDFNLDELFWRLKTKQLHVKQCEVYVSSVVVLLLNNNFSP